MGLTLKQASKALGMGEDEVMELVSAGRLKAERAGNRLKFDESDIEALARAEPGPAPAPDAPLPGRPRQVSIFEAIVRPVLDRIAALEKQVAEGFFLLSENQHLAEEVRRLERELALKDTETEKLKRDLVYQKKLLEKEVEDRMRVLDEKWALMDREMSERVVREREEFEGRLARERSTWSDRLAAEQERFESNLAQLRSKEGFWSRLLRMLTWS
jgi:excisionase family DNA binding protein